MGPKCSQVTQIVGFLNQTFNPEQIDEIAFLHGDTNSQKLKVD